MKEEPHSYTDVNSWFRLSCEAQLGFQMKGIRQLDISVYPSTFDCLVLLLLSLPRTEICFSGSVMFA